MPRLRTLIAFAVALLVAVAALVAYSVIESGGSFRHIDELALMVAIYAYGSIVLVGVPAYLLLRRYSRFGLAIAVCYGVPIGILCWFIAMFVVPYVLTRTGPSGGGDWFFLVGLPSLIGPACTTVFWLIDRPDRHAKPPVPDHEKRAAIGFAVVPLLAPLVLSLYFAINTEGSLMLFIFMFGAIFAYAATLLAGVPLYLALRHLRWDSVFTIALCGAVIGLGCWMFFLFVFPLTMGAPARDWRDVLATLGIFHFLILPALLGAASGLAFWLIARPNRLPPRRVILEQ